MYRVAAASEDGRSQLACRVCGVPADVNNMRRMLTIKSQPGF
jgi:hypothetical protein